MFLVFAIGFGLIVGSFLNVVILRHRIGLAPNGRSACMTCRRVLRWFELIPVVSYVMQLGRCRSCRVALSFQYPLVELATALLFALVFVRVVGTADPLTLPLSTLGLLVVHLAIWSTLVVIFVYDLQTKLIPDQFNLMFFLCALASVLVESDAVHLLFMSFAPLPLVLGAWGMVGQHVLAGGMFFLPFYGLWKFSEGRWIGLGDGKLAIGVGTLLGFEAGASALMFGFWIGAVAALGIMGGERLLRHMRARSGWAGPTLSLKSEIPLGPFLIAGVAVVYFTGLTVSSLF